MTKHLIALAILALLAIPLARRFGDIVGHWAYLRHARWAMALQVVLIPTLLGGAVLLESAIPALGWSWLHWLSLQGTNVIADSVRDAYVGWLVFGVFVLSIPQLAYVEEEMFREGTTSWRNGFLRSLLFGLVHCLVGVPVSIGLMLTVLGLTFTGWYFVGGIPTSTAAHAIWNFMVMTIVFLKLWGQS